MPYNGDFIKRHAEAVSLFEDITVIHVVRDTAGQVTKSVHTETKKQNNLTEVIIYYYVPSRQIEFLEKIISFRKYKSVYKAAIRNHINENGKPDLVHVHMGMQPATVALWLNKNLQVPIIVTEHWTGFLKEAVERFSMLPFYVRRQWQRLIKKAASVSVVSEYLGKGMTSLFSSDNIKIFPNVVNDVVFKYSIKKQNENPVFLHVSGLDDFKNPLLILEALKNFHTEYPGATMNIIGSTRKEIIEKAAEMNLQDVVFFYPEMPQSELCEYMSKADALILYSKYETFGCVIIEANACGTPVIVSDIPVFHETVAAGVNGVFAGKENVQLLLEKMKWVIGNRSQFNGNAISQTALSKYGYKTVGKQFSDWYREIVNQP